MSEALLLPTSDGHHNRADLAMIERAVRHGWKIPLEWTDKLPEVAARIAADTGKNDRERLRALELIAALLRDNVAAAVQLDKINRLDAGESTENVRQVVKIVIE
jgi:hypothetical protein